MRDIHDPNGGEHGEGFEDVEEPFVGEEGTGGGGWLGVFDQAPDDADLCVESA